MWAYNSHFIILKLICFIVWNITTLGTIRPFTFNYLLDFFRLSLIDQQVWRPYLISPTVYLSNSYHQWVTSYLNQPRLLDEYTSGVELLSYLPGINGKGPIPSSFSSYHIVCVDVLFNVYFLIRCFPVVSPRGLANPTLHLTSWICKGLETASNVTSVSIYKALRNSEF